MFRLSQFVFFILFSLNTIPSVAQGINAPSSAIECDNQWRTEWVQARAGRHAALLKLSKMYDEGFFPPGVHRGEGGIDESVQNKILILNLFRFAILFDRLKSDISQRYILMLLDKVKRWIILEDGTSRAGACLSRSNDVVACLKLKSSLFLSFKTWRDELYHRASQLTRKGFPFRD